MSGKEIFGCTDAQVGDSVAFFKQIGRKSVPERRGPAVVLDMSGTGVTAKLQSRTFEVTRYPRDLACVELGPASGVGVGRTCGRSWWGMRDPRVNLRPS